MRAFVGLPIPEPWIAPVVRAQNAVRGGRDVPVDDLHLTLAFLDDQPEERLEALHEMLEARRLGAAAMQPLAWSVFGAGRARLVALELAATAELSALRDRVRSACRAAGIDLSRERFRPHVTIIRFPASAPPDMARLPGEVEGLGLPTMESATARQATLWTSALTPGGPVYEAMTSYPLRAA